jgi:phage-related protein
MGLWEIRTHLENKIVRILFTVNKDNIILLHEFIKKDQKIPKDDLDLAKNRMKKFKQNERAKQ